MFGIPTEKEKERDKAANVEKCMIDDDLEGHQSLFLLRRRRRRRRRRREGGGAAAEITRTTRTILTDWPHGLGGTG